MSRPEYYPEQWLNGERPPRLSVMGRSRGSAVFVDASDNSCVIEEGHGNTLVLGLYRHVMILRVKHVRSLLPLLQTFAFTGQIMRPVEEDYSI